MRSPPPVGYSAAEACAPQPIRGLLEVPMRRIGRRGPAAASFVALALGAALGAAGAITDVTPTTLSYGLDVRAFGSGFGTAKPKILLAPEGGGKSKKLKVVSFDDTQVVGRVGAVKAGTYRVVVDPKDKGLATVTSESTVDVSLPVFVRFEPAEAARNGETVLVAGSLGTKKGRVTVGGKPAKVLEWTGGGVTLRLNKKTPLGTQDVVVKNTAGSVTFAGALDVVAQPGGSGFGGPITDNPFASDTPGITYQVDGVTPTSNFSTPRFEPLTRPNAGTNTRLLVDANDFTQVEFNYDLSAPLPGNPDQTKVLAPPKLNMILRFIDGRVYATTTDQNVGDVIEGSAVSLTVTGPAAGILGYGGKFSATLVKVAGNGPATIQITNGFFWARPKSF